MDWRHLGQILAAGDNVYDEVKNLCIWSKTNAGMGSLYRSQHELVFVFKRSTAPRINNVELGKFGRNRTNVWIYPGVNTFRADRMDELRPALDGQARRDGRRRYQRLLPAQRHHPRSLRRQR